jgi:hypothetical protein
MGGARAVAQHAVAALEQIGIDHRVFDTANYERAFTSLLKDPTPDMVADLLNQSLAVQCLDSEATHLLVPALSPVTVFTLNVLRKHNVKTIHWFFEDFRRARYWESVVPGYDCFCAIQRGPIEAACAKHGTRYLFLPTAAAGMPTETEGGDTPCDVVFVGIPSAYRISVLEHLAERGVDLAIGGHGWDSYHGVLDSHIRQRAWIDGEALSRLLRSAKIGINMSVESPDTDRENTHISPRVFDILLHDLVLVTEDVPLLGETLPSARAHLFSDKDQALARIHSILADHEQERTHAQSNRELVAASHTYRQRMESLIREVQS